MARGVLDIQKRVNGLKDWMRDLRVKHPLDNAYFTRGQRETTRRSRGEQVPGNMGEITGKPGEIFINSLKKRVHTEPDYRALQQGNCNNFEEPSDLPWLDFDEDHTYSVSPVDTQEGPKWAVNHATNGRISVHDTQQEAETHAEKHGFRQSLQKLMFAGDSTGQNSPESVDKAKKVCHGCPVKTKCLNWALENPEEELGGSGVLGGTTGGERSVVRELLTSPSPKSRRYLPEIVSALLDRNK